ncbi:hypothetical protein HBI49_210020 [Parastagonospora nodorum]|nr:hypothetical protein HBH42_193640 [Parastagonospora nodorum]KAH4600724.1 hypothetical protein HBH82_185180 [Parastagonospora nodorum]KAH4663654.1 hypothetical protein HBH78_211250 [Parastagonospora nodorum]KAH4698365.1 hypothetical protein HBH67_176140 [Parastagonospora nodorum]KAH4759216.1 hypothetical protein HBH63_221240 [Parastagonospora nodorum]
MGPPKGSQARFVFPAREMTPDHTPEYTSGNLTPETSHTKLTELEKATATPDSTADLQIGETTSSTADDERLLPRFFRLLDQSKALVNTHGPHTTYAGTNVFARAPIVRNETEQASIKDFATSLAAAQDCIESAQLDGAAREDLATFLRLSRTTSEVLEGILDSSDLDFETLGWGVYGLSAGYMVSTTRREASPILAYKKRLHDALRKMPSINSRVRKNLDSVACCGGKIDVLAKANREIHICANLLLQQFRREEWRRVRWYHAVAVAKRWADHLEPWNEGS